MSYRWVEHTGEVELELHGSDEGDVLAEAARALGELLGAGEGDAVEWPVAVEAEDRGALLVRWLEELVYLAETEGLVPDDAVVTVEAGAARGRVRGRRSAASPLVKAVTYHRLELASTDDGFAARVVLDV